MRFFVRCFGGAVFTALFVVYAALAGAQGRAGAQLYVFGNSLVHHEKGQGATSVPYWLGQLARASDKEFAASGHWGFLRDFPRDLPPRADWQFDGVTPLWSPDQGAFAGANTDTILLAPENFIQFQNPKRPFAWDNPQGTSPLSESLSLLDWVAERRQGQRYFIYEGWADMGDRAKKFPPTARELKRYLSFNGSGYHKWFQSYVKQLQKARPGLDIRLIPVAKTLAGLLAQKPFSDLPATVWFTDDAPHGTPSLYFLASLITYQAVFEAPAPAEFIPPADLHPSVVENYRAIVRFIETGTALDKPLPKLEKAAVQTPDLPLPPALAMGLDGVADWSAQQPFVNIMKSARPWIGHLRGQWGGWDATDLAKGGFLDENGWPMEIPENLTKIETFILTNQPPEARYLVGRYRLTYKGEGRVRLGALARKISYRPGEIWFTFSPGEDPVGVSIEITDPNGTGDYIRDIAVVKQEDIPLYEVGALFNPRWVARIRDLRSLRFMDWMFTNGSPITTWAERPKPADYTYVRRGVPLEVMVTLANEVGADPWFNMPHLADLDYSRQFASYVRDQLNPKLKTYVEYSNEMWNYIFPQAQWAAAQAEARWGDQGAEDGWVQFAGMKAAQMAEVWGQVYGPEARDRLVRVIATHTDWPGLENGLLQAPLAQAEGLAAPVDSFDAYGVTGYVGHELGSDELAPRVLEWIADSKADAKAAGAAKGLQRVSLRVYVEKNGFQAAFAPAAQAIRQGSLAQLIGETLPYQAKVAADNGLQLVMYEGGTHVVGVENWVQNETLTAFFTAFNYSPEMAGIYRQLLQGWRDAGGTLFNAFVDVARTSQWGSWGALRHLEDDNPRWDALMEFNRNSGAGWSNRPAAVFAQGVTTWGSEADETLQGTPLADNLLGRDGDDLLISNGGNDRLHGGAGMDRAILPGSRDAITVTREGALTIVTTPAATLRLFSVEQVSFADQPDVVYALSDL